MTKKKLNIAIDGPSGAGKSSLAKSLAQRLGLLYLDTGAIYRTVGLCVSRAGKNPHDEGEVAELLPKMEIQLLHVDGAQHMMLCGADVSGMIRTQEMSMYASAVSKHPAVRSFLFDMQRAYANAGGVVMDGRDIGTVIMPDADVKIFLSAQPQARARRRYEELTARGEQADYDVILAQTIERDRNDAGRAVAPAVAADDAVPLDNSSFTPEQTLEAALEIVANKTRTAE